MGSGQSWMPRIVLVSSGGMYTEKLDANDPMLDNWWRFDGSRAYSQNKRAQVVLAERWASSRRVGNVALDKNVFVASMHPGWCDTAAVRTALPSFHRSHQAVLKTPEEG